MDSNIKTGYLVLFVHRSFRSVLISTLWSRIKQRKKVQHWADLNFKTGYLVLLVQRSARSVLISTLWSRIKQKRVQYWADLNFKTGYLVLFVQRSVRSVLISTLWSGIKQQKRVQHWALSPASFPTSLSSDHCVVDFADWNAQSVESDSIIQMNAVRFIW